MSPDDRKLIDRLIEAGRRDTAQNETERQARIYAGVLAAGAGDGGGSGAAGPRTLHSWIGFTALGLGALALMVAGSGALSGSTGKTSDVRPAAEAPASPSAAAPPSASAAEPPPDATSGGTSVWELPSVPTPKKALAAPSAENDDLARELAVIASARRKLREHDPAGAMSLLVDFDRRFPRPRVGDEATVLRVEVLLALGRSSEARRLGRDFIAGHPDSIYRARLAQLLGDASQ